MADRDYIMQVKNLSKFYGSNVTAAKKMMAANNNKQDILKKTGVAVAVNDVSFNVERGKIFVIIGLSGSGKSTIVRCINMLQKPTSGSILFEDEDITKFNKKELLAFRRSKVAMVFQSFGLMSHRNVMENIAFGLEIKGVPQKEREAKAAEYIEMVGLEGWESYKVSALSGGMRQRVGIARALCTNPDLLLLDEPFSALDPMVRKEMQFELLSIQKNLHKTVIFITHDIDEAFKMGDMVAIMKDGVIEQIDTPENMTLHPANDYVKEFIGSVDKSRVYSAKNIMKVPTCLIKYSDGASNAIREMRNNNVSTAYVVDEDMKFLGLVTIESAIRARNEKLKLEDVLITSYKSVLLETPMYDIIGLAADYAYPIAVMDNGGRLKGIISRATILSIMSEE